MEVALIALIALSITLVVAVIGEDSRNSSSVLKEKCSEIPELKDRIRADRSNAMFAGLSDEEVRQVIDYLMEDEQLNLVPTSNANLSSNYIYSIENYLPDKTELAKWLDGECESQPQRKAKVFLFMGEFKEIKEFLVSPIPNPTQKAEKITVGKQPSWRSRPIDPIVEYSALIAFLSKELKPAQNLLTESFAPRCQEPTIDGCFSFSIAVRSRAVQSNDRYIIIWMFLHSDNAEAYYVNSLPASIIVKTPADSYDYELVQLFYNQRNFSSVDMLVDEYATNSTMHYRANDLDKVFGKFGSPQREIVDDLTADAQRPPLQSYPDGARFRVTQQYVEWLGWSFSLHSRTVSGMQIMDVRFQNEKIAFELSMQDILVVYSGTSPDDFFRSYIDNGWNTGTTTMPLIRDVDCPNGAVYIDSNVYGPGRDSPLKLKDAICIFEHRNSIPLRRHYSTDYYNGGYRFAFSMPDTVLVVRQILTVWNYDYIYDYEFHQNGVIEAKVSSTGYIQTLTMAGVTDNRYGYRITPEWDTYGLFHQHLFNFKIDIDVAGTSNRFKRIHLESEKVESEFAGSGYYQTKLRETTVCNEEAAIVRYNFDKPQYYVVTNNKEMAHSDESLQSEKSYRIAVNGFHNIVIPDEMPLLKGPSWAKYQLAVTKYKESERTTASYFVQGDPFDPAVSFDRFIEDNDGIVDKDLVVWATVGIHHIPTYEDLPVTTTPGKTLTVSLIPFNFFKRDPSILSRDATLFWKLFGVENEFHTVGGGICPIPEREPFISA